jgi:elongation factor P--(R)-beta-lysine ligase
MILLLQSHYELRKTVPLTPRLAQGKLFKHLERWGLCDETGTLWPLEHRDFKFVASSQKNLNSDAELNMDGAWVRLRIEFQKQPGSVVSKYDDSGFSAKIICIEEFVIPEELEAGFLSGAVSQLIKSSSLKLLLNANAETPSETFFFENEISVHKKSVEKFERVFESVQKSFESKGFFRARTPTLVPSGGVERYLSSFQSQYFDHRGNQHTVELPTSPEFSLKKLLCQGYSKVFDIARAFRNGGELSAWHEPEFWMLEWYRAGETLATVQKDTAEIVAKIAKQLGSTLTLPEVWPIFKVPQLFADVLGKPLEQLQEVSDFYLLAKQKCRSVTSTDDWDTVFSKVMMECVEPDLPNACFVEDFPIQMGALAQKIPQLPFVKRFEAYLCGVEICNGYQELTDFSEMKSRFDAIESARLVDKKPLQRDSVFEKQMGCGFPQAAGNALGLERVVALLLQHKGIGQLRPISFARQFPARQIPLD